MYDGCCSVRWRLKKVAGKLRAKVATKKRVGGAFRLAPALDAVLRWPPLWIGITFAAFQSLGTTPSSRIYRKRGVLISCLIQFKNGTRSLAPATLSLNLSSSYTIVILIRRKLPVWYYMVISQYGRLNVATIVFLKHKPHSPNSNPKP